MPVGVTWPIVRVEERSQKIWLDRYRPQLTRRIEAAHSHPVHLPAVTQFHRRYRLPKDMQAGCFAVYDRYIQKTTYAPLHEHQMSYESILFSLLGIETLGLCNSYFEDHRDEFIKIWPKALRWMKAKLEGGQLHGYEKIFFEIANSIFIIAQTVSEETTKTNDAFELAVSLWNGYRSGLGGGHFSTLPLVTCLVPISKEIDTKRMHQVLNGYDSSGQLTKKILWRMQSATSRSSSIEVKTVYYLIGLMEVLERFHEESKATTLSFLFPDVGASLVTIANNLMDVSTISDDHLRAAGLFCKVISRCFEQRSENARKIVETGFLDLVLKLASHDVKCTRYALEELTRCLINQDVVVECQEKLGDAAADGSKFEDLLKATSGEFIKTWRAFENAVLEQAALSQLFRRGYSFEVGTCANLTCRAVGVRRARNQSFKKCAGCGFNLYCSQTCQALDWNQHKVRCKKVDKKKYDVDADRNQRFARRLADVQINRHLENIFCLAKMKNIRPDDIAIRIRFDVFPYTMEVVDYREFLDESKHSPIHALVASEVQRRLKTSNKKSNLRMVIVRTEKDASSERPHMVTLTNAWTKAITNGVPVGADGEGVDYRNEDSRQYYCSKMDGVRATMRFAWKYALELGKPVWSKDVLKKAAAPVMRQSWKTREVFRILGFSLAEHHFDKSCNI